MKLKQYLTEQSVDCEGIFGKYLFGEYKKFYKTIKEPDTELESDVFNSLLQWVQSAGQRQIIGQNLSKLLKCKEQYPKILNQKKGTYYRIVTFQPNKNEIAKDVLEFEFKINQADDSLEFWKDNEKEFLKYQDGKILYKPQFKLESWSINKTSALKFAKKSKHISTSMAGQRNGSSFVIKAELSNDELLFNPKFMNMVAVDQGWWPQNEVLRLTTSKKPVNARLFYLTPLLKLSRYGMPSDVKKNIESKIKSKWNSY